MNLERIHIPSPSFATFWEKGRGNAMLQKLNSLPDLKHIENLIPLYFQADCLADSAVEETYIPLGFTAGQNQFLHAFEKPFNSATHPNSTALLEEIQTIPGWFDSNLYNAGIELCQRSGTAGLMVLRNYALMGGYESAAINKPLIYTGALKKGAAKRLRETTEFWLQVVGPMAFENKLLHRYALQTRLIHSYSRVMIKKHSDWDTNCWGEPLNTWDMVATNLGFSLVFLDGLRALGFKPTETEVKGLFHFWKYMGYLLGIPVGLLPNTEIEAIEALYLWTMNQPGGDSDTQALARALMEEPLESPFPKYSWQKWLVKKMHLGYNAHFLGKTSCTNLGLPYSGFRHVVKFQESIQKIKERKIIRSTLKRQQEIAKNRKKQEEIVALFYAIKSTSN